MWDKPSYACLATRIPAGTAITAADLERVERGEQALAGLASGTSACGCGGESGLLQVRADQWEEARRRPGEIRALLAGDFPQVALDGAPRPVRES